MEWHCGVWRRLSAAVIYRCVSLAPVQWVLTLVTLQGSLLCRYSISLGSYPNRHLNGLEDLGSPGKFGSLNRAPVLPTGYSPTRYFMNHATSFSITICILAFILNMWPSPGATTISTVPFLILTRLSIS